MPNLDASRIDQLLATLTGIVRARVRTSQDEAGLVEVHLLSDGSVNPKQIVRNVETLLKTAFDLTIDHRIVSIAVLKQGAPLARSTADGDDRQGDDRREIARPVGVNPSASSSPVPRGGSGPPRLVFQRLRVTQDESLKCTAHVELRLGDVIFEGTHRDTDTPRARMYSSARAVIEALDYLAEKEMALYLAGLELLRVFQRDVMVVLVEGRHEMSQIRLLGTAMIEDDPYEAAVRAVLDAVNRFIARPSRRSRRPGR